ncbi:hypothetical protein K505DRAFT_330409 [Melanomma pulvis-pyrius CBS 109.77]|uniref:Methyltransferase domain-containing protein n=1 Tax=Melanomma pulvis-pyrius CBS 109.77 TaxID=1314802 RepID=A0A6A6WQK7_9PLEO|nr:hypothetical protein K505DRAFT_330409 [Melanomma pulvis-pyrius CBS 109.77]
MALKNFNPDAFLESWSEDFVPSEEKPFEKCIRAAFNLSEKDAYVYRAQGTTTLDMTQAAINGKRKNGLHGWYHDVDGQPSDPPHPTSEEVTAYTALFQPSVSLPKALKGIKANSKANTLRATIATHLSTRFFNHTTSLLPSKKPRIHKNPYLDLWTYSCQELEWAGPQPSTTSTKISHHILPIFYHHFGCVVPTYSALSVIAKLAQPSKPSKEPVRPILDIGSGNGFWTFMLRNLSLEAGMLPLQVHAVDNQTSEYRVTWIPDTILTTGVEYLAKNANGKGAVLLLVYPQATGDFTETVLRAFEGDVVVVAGTQNGNGFTGFREKQVEEWIEGELGSWELVLRMPLPSFAGKDEGLFVWTRRKA